MSTVKNIDSGICFLNFSSITGISVEPQSIIVLTKLSINIAKQSGNDKAKTER